MREYIFEMAGNDNHQTIAAATARLLGFSVQAELLSGRFTSEAYALYNTVITNSSLPDVRVSLLIAVREGSDDSPELMSLAHSATQYWVQYLLDMEQKKGPEE